MNNVESPFNPIHSITMVVMLINLLTFIFSSTSLEISFQFFCLFINSNLCCPSILGYELYHCPVVKLLGTILQEKIIFSSPVLVVSSSCLEGRLSMSSSSCLSWSDLVLYICCSVSDLLWIHICTCPLIQKLFFIQKIKKKKTKENKKQNKNQNKNTVSFSNKTSHCGCHF